jgi:hypothetical protein
MFYSGRFVKGEFRGIAETVEPNAPVQITDAAASIICMSFRKSCPTLDTPPCAGSGSGINDDGIRVEDPMGRGRQPEQNPSLRVAAQRS